MKQLKKHRKKALNFVARFEWRLSKTCAQLSSDTLYSFLKMCPIFVGSAYNFGEVKLIGDAKFFAIIFTYLRQ